MDKLEFLPDLKGCVLLERETRHYEAAEKPLSLSGLEVGEGGWVSEILVSGGMRRRLMDIGLIEGTYVQCLQRSPSGDPVAYLIRGAVIALRNEDAVQVIINSP